MPHISCQKLNQLHPRLVYILEKRFLEKETLKNIGKRFDVTGERIRQLEKQALKQCKTSTATIETSL